MYQINCQSLATELELRGYSPRTVKAYRNYLHQFLTFTDKPVNDLSEEDLRVFLHHLISNKLSTSYINSVYSATKLYFTHILKRPFSLDDVPRVKRAKKLPLVLSFNEVTAILEATDNIKHKAMLMLAYSAGLRVSEVINLKISDIDSANMQIHVRSGKGNKDRYTLLSDKTLLFLRQYYKQYRPTDWLFPSHPERSKPLTTRTVQRAFKASVLKAGIVKPVTVHTLRHAFATHLLIQGTHLMTIKTLLGHKNIQTTMVYLHLAPSKVLSVKSPFDLEVDDFE